MLRTLAVILGLLLIPGCSYNGERVIAFKSIRITKDPRADEFEPISQRYGFMLMFELFPGEKRPFSLFYTKEELEDLGREEYYRKYYGPPEWNDD